MFLLYTKPHRLSNTHETQQTQVVWHGIGPISSADVSIIGPIVADPYRFHYVRVLSARCRCEHSARFRADIGNDVSLWRLGFGSRPGRSRLVGVPCVIHCLSHVSSIRGLIPASFFTLGRCPLLKKYRPLKILEYTEK